MGSNCCRRQAGSEIASKQPKKFVSPRVYNIEIDHATGPEVVNAQLPRCHRWIQDLAWMKPRQFGSAHSRVICRSIDPIPNTHDPPAKYRFTGERDVSYT